MYTFNMLTKWMMYWILLSQSLNWPLVIGLPKPPVDSMMISSWRNRQLAADYHQTDTNDQYSKRLEHRLLNHVERHDASQRRHATPLLMHDLYHIRAQQHQQQNNQHEEQSHYPVKHNYNDIPFVSQMLTSSVVRNYYHQGKIKTIEFFNYFLPDYNIKTIYSYNPSKMTHNRPNADQDISLN